MKIAICDDDKAEIIQIDYFIKEYNQSHNMEMSLIAYQSPVELISKIQKGVYFDIIFLDIMMPSLNGIDAAKEIREHDKNVKIIFITSSPDFAIDSYSVGAYYYALKPIIKTKFFSIFDAAILEIERHNNEYLIVKSKDLISKVPINALEYCEIINKTICYYLSNGKVIESSGSLKELETSIFKFKRFLKPHRSFIINMDYIKSVSQKNVEMQSKAKIPIPRGKYNEIKQAFLDFSFSKECNK